VVFVVVNSTSVVDDRCAAGEVKGRVVVVPFPKDITIHAVTRFI